MEEQGVLIVQKTIKEVADNERSVQLAQPSSNDFPSHWSVELLRDIGELKDGDWILREDYSDQGVRLLQVGDIGLGEFIGKSSRYIFMDRAVELKCTFLSSGDILISRMAEPVGRACVLPDLPYPSITAVDVSIFRINVDVVNRLYAVFALNYSGTLVQAEALAYGVTRKRITRMNLAKVKIPLPPLPEQRAIAHVLGTAQEAIQTRRRELELEHELKAALMQYLFTYGTGNELLKQTELGDMPQSWQIVKLGELCSDGLGTIQTGPFGSQLHASDYGETGIPVVNPTHLGFNTIVEDHLPFIDEEDAERLSRHYLFEGDILVSRRGDFSRYSYITSRYSGWLCGTGCLLIRLNNPLVDNYFVSISLGTEVTQTYLHQNAVGSIMPNLNTKILQALPLALPPVSEQRQIADVLRACDTKIATLEQEISLLQELFQALLEELMTGRLSTIPLIETENIQ